MPPHQYRHQFNDTYPAAPVKEDCSALDSDLLVGVVIPPFFAMGFLVSLVITLWNRWTYITRTKKLEEENRRLRFKNQLNEYWHGPISDDLVDAELKDPGSHTGGAKRPESGSDHVRDVDRDGGTQSRLATYDDAGFYVSGGRDGADQEESEESRERSRDLSTIAEETEVSADAVLRSIPDEPDHRFAVGSDSDEDEWERAEPDYMAGGGESSIPLEPLKRVGPPSKTTPSDKANLPSRSHLPANTNLTAKSGLLLAQSILPLAVAGFLPAQSSLLPKASFLDRTHLPCKVSPLHKTGPIDEANLSQKASPCGKRVSIRHRAKAERSLQVSQNHEKGGSL
ncbi:hypothetical protein COL940_003464 [Colletotrichum noveboracense]|nr:hypothetical protein COL940_003464 [Colletotrichum noveboracense]